MPSLAGKVIERRLLLVGRLTSMLDPLSPHNLRNSFLAFGLFVQIADGVQHGPLGSGLPLPNLLECGLSGIQAGAAGLPHSGRSCRLHPRRHLLSMGGRSVRHELGLLLQTTSLGLSLREQQFAELLLLRAEPQHASQRGLEALHIEGLMWRSDCK